MESFMKTEIYLSTISISVNLSFQRQTATENDLVSLIFTLAVFKAVYSQ